MECKVFCTTYISVLYDAFDHILPVLLGDDLGQQGVHRLDLRIAFPPCARTRSTTFACHANPSLRKRSNNQTVRIGLFYRVIVSLEVWLIKLVMPLSQSLTPKARTTSAQYAEQAAATAGQMGVAYGARRGELDVESISRL